MNIAIIGLGYVGLTLSVSLANRGANVFGCEKNEEILKHLDSGQAHFYEDNLNPILRKVIESGNFRFGSKLDRAIDYDYFIITVGTPLRGQERVIDLSSLKKALSELTGFYDGSQVIILRSTVEVGTTMSVALPMLRSLLDAGSDLEPLVAFCPERTVEGKAMVELEDLPQIVSGNTKDALDGAKNVFRLLNVQCIETPSIEGAELIKLFNNTYRDIQFAIGNFFNEIAQQYGLNGSQLIDIANQDYARSNIAKPGLVGGPCLEKDPYILTSKLKNSPGANFVRFARHHNELLEMQIVKWVEHNTNNKKSQKILVMGMAFKGKPETSDLRGSNSVSIVKKLLTLGYSMDVQDFCAFEQELLNLSENVYQFSPDSRNTYDLILILNNHNNYEKITLDWLNNNLSRNGKVFDCWDVLTCSDKKKIVSLGEILTSQEADT